MRQDLDLWKSTGGEEKVAFGSRWERASLLFGLSILLILLAGFGILTFGLAILAGAVGVFRMVGHVWKMRADDAEATSDTAPRLHRLLSIAAWRLGTPLPQLYLSEARDVNAYAAGTRKNGAVLLTREILEIADDEELLFTIGHEVGHLKKGHVLFQSLSGGARGSATLSTPILSPFLNLIFSGWSRQAEYTADEAGLLVCRNPQAAVSMMRKLRGSMSLERTPDYDDEGNDLKSRVCEVFGSHPLNKRRVAALKRRAVEWGWEL